MKNEKIKLTHKRWARITAFILFVLLVPVMLGSAVVIAFGVEDGWYENENASFYESSFCENRAYSDTYRVLDAVMNDWYYPEYYDSEYTNFLFVVKDENGNTVAQNCDGETAVLILEGVGWHNGGRLLTADAYVRAPLEIRDHYYMMNTVFNLFYSERYTAIALLCVSAVLLIAMFVFLLCAAGHRAGVEGIRLSRLDRTPLDLFLAAAVIAVACGTMLAVEFSYNYVMEAVVYGIMSMLVAAVVMETLITLSARIKAGKFWRNTIIWRFRGVLWRICKKVWAVLKRIFENTPLIWKAILTFIIFILINLVLAVIGFYGGSFFALFLALLFDLGAFILVCFGAIELRMLQKAGQELARGNLDYKVDTAKLHLELKGHGYNLNSASEGLSRAVDARIRSESFKTELITNVSHDIKTPLTSIINYVDLLKKEDLQNEKAREYIEVLERQSSRLKKLTEDLVEASKASSGAMNVNLEATDAAELLRQAVGEYRDRFALNAIEPVINAPDGKLMVMADGKLLWRVFDNLLGNICKYSQPGTRAYFTLDDSDGRVWMIFKNISREVLNITAEELTERFVRGDSSRSTEGSGLGLSIAQSLTELQGGNFRIFLDGDLFKVMLIFDRLAEGSED